MSCLPAAALLAALALPVSAKANGTDVVRDCVQGTLKSHYATGDYEQALADMPTDVAEYTDCRDQISAARDRDLASTTASGDAGQTARKMAAILGAAAAGGDGSRGDGGPSEPSRATAADDPPSASTTWETTPSLAGVATAGDPQLAPISFDSGWSAAPEPDAAAKLWPLIPVALALAIVLASAGRLAAGYLRRIDAGHPPGDA